MFGTHGDDVTTCTAVNITRYRDGHFGFKCTDLSSVSEGFSLRDQCDAQLLSPACFQGSCCSLFCLLLILVYGHTIPSLMILQPRKWLKSASLLISTPPQKPNIYCHHDWWRPGRVQCNRSSADTVQLYHYSLNFLGLSIIAQTITKVVQGISC